MEREILDIASLEELPEAAERIISYLRDNPVAAFFGPMGAGKTTLIRAIAERLGVKDTVTSPTFALVNQYALPDGRTINHFDFYRIGKIEEAYDLGYEEYFYSGEPCLIEWPEKIEELLPEDALRIVITPDPGIKERRVVEISRRAF